MMQFFLTQWIGGGARAVLLVVGLLAGLSLRPQAAQASHLRAGDIRATLDTTVGPTFNARRVFFRMSFIPIMAPIMPRLKMPPFSMVMAHQAARIRYHAGDRKFYLPRTRE